MDGQKSESGVVWYCLRMKRPQLINFRCACTQVCEVADICCDGRVVSVLEGGYGRTPPAVPAPPLFDSEAPETTEPVKQKLDKSFFSECALQHLQGLVDPYHPDEEQQKNAK